MYDLINIRVLGFPLTVYKGPVTIKQKYIQRYKNLCCIYVIWNLITRKCYVGSSYIVGNRWNGHVKMLNNGFHHSRKLQNSWNKHGSRAFEFHVLEFIDGSIDKKVLQDKETIWISVLDSYKSGYNMTPYGDFRFEITPKIRVRSRRNLAFLKEEGLIYTPEWLETNRKILVERNKSEEQCRIVREVRWTEERKEAERLKTIERNKTPRMREVTAERNRSEHMRNVTAERNRGEKQKSAVRVYWANEENRVKKSEEVKNRHKSNSPEQKAVTAEKIRKNAEEKKKQRLLDISITAFSLTKSLFEWIQLSGLTERLIKNRLSKGMSPEDVLTIPNSKGNCYKIDGVVRSPKDAYPKWTEERKEAACKVIIERNKSQKQKDSVSASWTPERRELESIRTKERWENGDFQNIERKEWTPERRVNQAEVMRRSTEKREVKKRMLLVNTVEALLSSN